MVTGSGTSSDPYILTSLSDLALIGTTGYALTAYYQLGCDIDASTTQESSYNSGAGFTPIGSSSSPFTGNFNGNSHSIRGLYINRASTDDVGLFSALGSGASVHDLTINGTIIGQNHVGSIAGDVNYTVSIVNCNFNGTITGTGYVGGIIGLGNPMDYTITITNCTPKGTITATADYVGGVIGFGIMDGRWIVSNIYIENNTLTINSSNSNYVGGLAGRLDVPTVSNCYINTDITGLTYVGGLVGFNQYSRSSSSYTNCYFNGNVSGTNYVGGLIGDINPWGNGHIITISQCYTIGIVTGTSYVGGFVGRIEQAGSTKLTDCFSTAEVTATGANVGGFVGYAQAAQMTRCYCIGKVTGGSSVGGFVGTDGGYSSSATDCFWDTETSGQTVSVFGTGKTTVQMKTRATYTDFDFTTTPVWVIDSSKNNGYPYLYGTPLPVIPSVIITASPISSVTSVKIPQLLFNGAIIIYAPTITSKTSIITPTILIKSPVTINAPSISSKALIKVPLLQSKVKVPPLKSTTTISPPIIAFLMEVKAGVTYNPDAIEDLQRDGLPVKISFNLTVGGEKYE